MPRVGVEAHITLNTDKKLFVAESTREREPNQDITPYTIAEPGTRPVINKEAVKKAIRFSKYIGMNVAKTLQFDRKTYFYPDLPKGYQLTQHRTPLATDGTMELKDGTTVQIRELHLEEDPAQITHEDNHTRITYNRAGMPLIELTTEPADLKPAHVEELLETIHDTAQYVSIRNSLGTLKADINISIPETEYTRVEIKNVQGLEHIQRIVNYEVVRQKHASRMGNLQRETRGWNEQSKTTYSLRDKETYRQYGYLPEQDIPEINLTTLTTRVTVPEPYAERKKRIQDHTDEDTARFIARTQTRTQLYDRAVEKGVSPPIVTEWIRRQLQQTLTYQKIQLQEEIFPHIIDVIQAVDEGRIAPEPAEKQLWKAVQGEQPVLEQADTNIPDVVDTHKKLLQKYSEGQTHLINVIIGKTKQELPQADPREIKQYVEETYGR